MHYSRLLLNVQSSQVRKDLASDHEMHRTVMSAFADLRLAEESNLRQRQNADSGSILWRVDRDRRRGIVMLLVQSELSPDWQPLRDRYPGYVTTPSDSDLPPISMMDRTLSFSPGKVFQFRLRANPTRKERTEGRKNGRRLGLVTPEEQRAWLKRKAADESSGFQLGRFDVVPNPDSQRHGGTANVIGEDQRATITRQLTHVAAIFEGTLSVTVPELFQQTLRSGIGSAKAFGFGLLSIARV